MRKKTPTSLGNLVANLVDCISFSFSFVSIDARDSTLRGPLCFSVISVAPLQSVEVSVWDAGLTSSRIKTYDNQPVKTLDEHKEEFKTQASPMASRH